MGNRRLTRHRLLVAATLTGVLAFVGPGVGTGLAGEADLPAGIHLVHKKPHTPDQLKAFTDVFMEQVRKGDLLFHGDGATQKQMGVKLSATGMACAMCHPMSADIHPYEYPKYQEQMAKFATLRDMINWCIEKPNQGEKIESDSDAMKALEAYVYWSTRGSALDPGRH
jgi:thiosulfate dehydrogenase